MTKITFLGTGAMGTRMAARLLSAKHQVTVWNRTAAGVAPLVAAGATSASTPREAVRNADIVFSMVKDDDASKAVWEAKETGALQGMKKGAVAVECSTLSVNRVKSLEKTALTHRVEFVEAPLAGSRPQAEAGQLIFFVGGKKSTYDLIDPLLLLMGGSAHYTGEIGTAAMVKLAVNGLFGIQLATMAELIGLFQKFNLDADHLIDVMGQTPVMSGAAGLASKAMLARNFAPMFPIDLVAKDFGYALQAAGSVKASVPMIDAAKAVYDTAIEDGYGGDNITGVAQLY